VFHVESGYVEVQMQGRGSDNQILECDGDSFGRLISLDASGKLGNGQRDWMHDQVAEDAFDKESSAFTVGAGSGPVDSVGQFHGADRRQGNIELAMSGPCRAKNILDCFAAPLACDQDAGVENESQGFSSTPNYREACGCG